jgi:ubiquitin carboxyl-terminal hydrolase L5
MAPRHQSPTILIDVQVPDNACATIALLNILMNAPSGVDIGEHLQQFKQFSIGMTPATCGLAIDNFQFIKDIHNSFGRYVTGVASICSL